MIHIEIDSSSGFCFGVTTAIQKAEEELAKGNTLYCLGDIVHNGKEVERLHARGLITINHEQLKQLHDVKVLLRAHGEPPSTFARARELGIDVADATCPVVAKLQQRVAAAHGKMRSVGGQVVLLGKRGHAEVVGLTGQVAEPTIVIESEADLDAVDFTRPIYFLSQTTQSVALFERLRDEMARRLPSPEMLTARDTICRQVSSRESALREFASRFDAVVFVCGRKSSNGRVLFEVCRAANPRSYNVEEASELRPEWFEGIGSVGVCGATSTPEWLMREVADAIAAMG